MARKKRGRVANQLLWTAMEWQRGWEIAMIRIDGAPGIVAGHVAFDHALDMLDYGFAHGDAFQFQLGLVTLMDCCNEAIGRGDCVQWW